MNKNFSVALLSCLFVTGAVALTIWSTTAEAQSEKKPYKLVRLKDGREFKGVVTRTATTIRVETKYGAQVYPLEQVESITDIQRPKDVYLEKLSKIDSSDAEALYGLAKWVWDKHGEDLELLKSARRNLTDALKLKKDYTRAGLLSKQIDGKIKFLEEGEPGKPPGPEAQFADTDLVSERDILWIRLMELDKGDHVTIRYKNKALQRYIQSIRGQAIDDWDRRGKERRFLALPRRLQVMEILRNKRDDTELLKDIHITSDPRFMLDFRTKIWPIVRQSCAAGNCHGGARPNGGMKLFVISGKNDRVDYTNFVILSGLLVKNHRLLNRQNPANSLLLQFGLNRKVAKVDKRHPREIPPIFSSIEATRYKIVSDWIKGLKGPMHPNYHLKYKPPFGMKLETSGRVDILGPNK